MAPHHKEEFHQPRQRENLLTKIYKPHLLNFQLTVCPIRESICEHPYYDSNGLETLKQSVSSKGSVAQLESVIFYRYSFCYIQTMVAET